MARVKVGLIGGGGIAQMMHRPYLKELDDRFEIAALSDISPGLLEQVARDYGGARTYVDYREMLERADLDVVLTRGREL